MVSHLKHARHEIIAIEKQLFRQNKQTIAQSAQVTDPGFVKYQARYQNATKSYAKTATLDALVQDVLSSQIVLVGDYHTLDQSQRSFVRLVRHVLRIRQSNVIVALEAVQSRFQPQLDAFCADRINATEFIKKIGFKSHWFFDLWPQYEVIFDFLKYHRIPVYAIEAPHYEKKSLHERDIHMSRQIADLARAHPDHIILTLVGDLHLAPQHLPHEIGQRFRQHKLPKPILSVVYQNSPAIYWQLAERGVVDYATIVKVREREYCRMHTPPLIVQQSYLNWLYHEEGGFDWIDAKASFLEILRRMARIMDFKLPRDWDDIEVYTCGDLSFIKKLKRTMSARDLKFVKRQLEHAQSYLLPRERIVYIANVSIHHAAEEASHYLKSILSGTESYDDRCQAFYANVLHEALGFFGSKLVNHKRKCAHHRDFLRQKKFLEQLGVSRERQSEYESVILILEQHRLLKKRQSIPARLVPAPTSDQFHLTTHALGYELGDRLYHGFMQQMIPAKTMRELYVVNFSSDQMDVAQMYIQLMRQTRTIKRPSDV